jgi:hypothetical protein
MQRLPTPGVFAAGANVLDVLADDKRVENSLPCSIDDRFMSFPVIQKQHGLRTVRAGDTHACAHIVSIDRFDEAGLRPCRFQWRAKQLQRVPSMIRGTGFKRGQPVQQCRRRNGQRLDRNSPPRHGQQTSIVGRMPIDHEYVFRRRADHPLRRVIETHGPTINEKDAATRRRFPGMSGLKFYCAHRMTSARGSPKTEA